MTQAGAQSISPLTSRCSRRERDVGFSRNLAVTEGATFRLSVPESLWGRVKRFVLLFLFKRNAKLT